MVEINLLSPRKEERAVRPELTDYVYAAFRQRDIEAGNIDDPDLFRIAQEAERRKWRIIEEVENGVYRTKETIFFASEAALRLVLLRMTAIIQLGKSENQFTNRRLENDLLEGRVYQPALMREFRKLITEYRLLGELSHCYFHDNETMKGSHFEPTDQEMIRRTTQRYKQEIGAWEEWSHRTVYSEKRNIYTFPMGLSRGTIPVDHMIETDRLLRQHFGEPVHYPLPTTLVTLLESIDPYARWGDQPVYYREFKDGTQHVVVDKYHRSTIPPIDFGHRNADVHISTDEIKYMLWDGGQDKEMRRALTDDEIRNFKLRDFEAKLEAESRYRRRTASTVQFYNIPSDWHGSGVETGLIPLLIK